MHYLVLLLLLVAALYGPRLWVRRVLRRHSRTREDLRHTGAGLCNWLIREYGLLGASVEETDRGDHYDPHTKTIRLSPRHYGGRSVTATAVALHELGHAIQHREGYEPLRIRHQIVGLTAHAERAGGVALMAGPAVAAVMPGLGRLMLIAGALTMLAAIPVRIVTLPVEFDASFGRALPIIREHALLPERDQPAARQILFACALTYVASALSSLLSIRRWFRILARR